MDDDPPEGPTTNYSFWWDCPDTTTSVSVAEANPLCGDLPEPNPGVCVIDDAVGAKCDGMSASNLTLPSHTYPSVRDYIAKVIAERGPIEVLPAQDQITITVEPLPQDFSIQANPTSIDAVCINPEQTCASSQTTIQVLPHNNFEGTVTLSANLANLPAGSLPNFSDPQLTCANANEDEIIGSDECETSEFWVTIPAGTPPGDDIDIPICGSSGSLVGRCLNPDLLLNIRNIRPVFQEI